MGARAVPVRQDDLLAHPQPADGDRVPALGPVEGEDGAGEDTGEGVLFDQEDRRCHDVLALSLQ